MRYCYKVTLLADVVMSSLSSTEVSESLDYLSGSAFMGIAANYLFKTKPKDYDVFDDIFSGKIRFLDAHPLIDGKRSFKIPLSLHKPKVKDDGEIYRFDGKPVPRTEIDPNADPKDTIQMKQVRKGFFTAESTTWRKVEPEHQYTMKSSYNRKSRRADDGALFGYDALVKGSEWGFVMEFDDEKETVAKELNDLFVSKNHRIGKSKTSQYGNVKIEKINEIPECPVFTSGNIYKVYADSRLCFFDENGQATFQPTPEQLGFKEGEILWNESFVRKYVFTPRNSMRNAYDGDIACIDKGSVIVVESSTGHDGRNVVGEYNSIGLGQIIVNPKFLEKEPEKLEPLKAESGTGKKDEVKCNNPLFKWLEAKQEEKDIEQKISEKVNAAFASMPKDVTSSQWGVLRAKSMMAIVQNKKWSEFETSIFSGEEAYLAKARLNKKWGEDKVNKLKNICKNVCDNSSWNDLQKLRFFELLCAAAAKKESTKQNQKKGGK
jgi:hypothetical protein